nr:MAG TPA: Molybdenum Cofactor Synthesis C [Caudoviricetes sp.]
MIIAVRDSHSSSYSCSDCTRTRLSAHKKTGISARIMTKLV